MASGLPILVVEDDLALREAVCDTLELAGQAVVAAAGGEEALQLLARQTVSLVVSDVRMLPIDGIALLKEIRSRFPHLPVVLMTAFADVDRAVEAMRAGACDFLLKPFEPKALLDHVQRYRLPEVLDDWVIASDPVSRNLFALATRVAQSDTTVLLTGESGVGKEVVARFIHQHSTRRKGPFVAINCAAIPENLLESELFGYEKGAFTGAARTTPGKIETANNGTLMLDEIGDLPHSLQAKLLRFLQERVIERIGGRQEIPVNVRIVCATHQNLKSLIAEGRFREDLFYRLAEIVVNIPPLRARSGDAALLAHAFVRRFAEEQNRGGISLREDALRAIDAHSWPGNVRELENCIKRAVIMADANQITADDVGLSGAGDNKKGVLDLRHARDDAERRAIIAALARADGNVVKASELLGVSRPTLYDLMHRFGLK